MSECGHGANLIVFGVDGRPYCTLCEIARLRALLREACRWLEDSDGNAESDPRVVIWYDNAVAALTTRPHKQKEVSDGYH